MNISEWIGLGSLVLAGASGLITYVIGGLRRSLDVAADTIARHEIAIAHSHQDRLALHAEVARLDAQKASREAVDGVQSQVRDLRREIVDRLDRLELLVREALSEGHLDRGGE